MPYLGGLNYDTNGNLITPGAGQQQWNNTLTTPGVNNPHNQGMDPSRLGGVPSGGGGGLASQPQQPPNPYMAPPPQAMQQPAGQRYTDAQVKQFIGDKGIADNPYAMYAHAQTYGVQPDQVDRALGANAGQSQAWMQSQGLGPIGGQQQPTQPPVTPQPTGQPPTQQPPGQQNPYMAQMGDDITRRVNNNLQRNILPGIGRNAVAAGGYGGSRQGVAEGIAVGESSDALSGQLANLYGGQFNTDRNYGLQSDALDLNVYNANQNWMRTGQQDQLGLIDRMMGWNQQGINNATTAQNTPLNYYNQFMNAGTQLGGMGGSNTQNNQGNPWLGAAGGALTAYNLYNNWNKP